MSILNTNSFSYPKRHGTLFKPIRSNPAHYDFINRRCLLAVFLMEITHFGMRNLPSNFFFMQHKNIQFIITMVNT